MANIMLTSICNLSCPYCFANEFVNRSNVEITEENFRKAMEFILRDGSEHSVGLIGGEPTTHSQFEKLLRIVLADRRVKVGSLYTNGILIDRFWPLMTLWFGFVGFHLLHLCCPAFPSHHPPEAFYGSCISSFSHPRP